MDNELSKTQIDKLGERLKQGAQSDDDLRMLDSYRQSFSEAYEYVVSTIRGNLFLQPTGRSAKSTLAIIDKLKRESVRLSQIQDIAGCRIILPVNLMQDEVVENLRSLFTEATAVDRRELTSHGYRAVHVVVRHLHKPIEIQVRTFLQHKWAEVSEKLSDVIDPAIKYGGGPEGVRHMLGEVSKMIAGQEVDEAKLAELSKRTQSIKPLPNNVKSDLDGFRAAVEKWNLRIADFLESTIAELSSKEK